MEAEITSTAQCVDEMMRALSSLDMVIAFGLVMFACYLFGVMSALSAYYPEIKAIRNGEGRQQ